MRLIDADALLEKWNKDCTDGNCLGDCWDCQFPTAIEELQNAPTIAAPRWVRCEERLPKDGEWVLIWGDGFHVPIQAFHESRCWLDDRFEKYTATHWMPLPEPPKEDV